MVLSKRACTTRAGSKPSSKRYIHLSEPADVRTAALAAPPLWLTSSEHLREDDSPQVCAMFDKLSPIAKVRTRLAEEGRIPTPRSPRPESDNCERRDGYPPRPTLAEISRHSTPSVAVEYVREPSVGNDHGRGAFGAQSSPTWLASSTLVRCTVVCGIARHCPHTCHCPTTPTASEAAGKLLFVSYRIPAPFDRRCARFSQTCAP